MWWSVTEEDLIRSNPASPNPPLPPAVSFRPIFSVNCQENADFYLLSKSPIDEKEELEEENQRTGLVIGNDDSDCEGAAGCGSRGWGLRTFFLY